MYEYKCKLVRVVDGDTIDVDVDLGFGVWLQKQRIRMYGIDTPESRTSDDVEKVYGNAAKAFLVKWTNSGNLTLKTFKDGKGNYAKSKGLGEIINENHLTLRTSVIGPELKTDGEELFHWFMSQSEKINGYTKVIWSGITTLILAKVVGWAIENKITGLYHVTNNKSIDKFALLTLIKKYTKKNILISPFDGKELNKSFIDSRKIINYKIPSYEQMVMKMILDTKSNNKQYNYKNL